MVYVLDQNLSGIQNSQADNVVIAQADNHAFVSNVDYNRTANITLTYVSPTSGTKTLSTASTSTFTNGVATITDTYSDAGVITITATDSSDTSIYGTSSEFKVKEGTIRVLDTSGSVGTLPVTVKLIDSDGNDITNDSGTEFTVTLSESRDDDTASSAAETSEVTFDAGEAEIEVTDTEAEVVTVTPVYEDYLDVIAGKVTFGGAGTPRFGSGAHILWWRELRQDEAR